VHRGGLGRDAVHVEQAGAHAVREPEHRATLSRPEVDRGQAFTRCQ
jgi:hypothetical protein